MKIFHSTRADPGRPERRDEISTSTSPDGNQSHPSPRLRVDATLTGANERRDVRYEYNETFPAVVARANPSRTRSRTPRDDTT